LSWLSKSGPFSEDFDIETTDDLWFFDGEEVTEQGLGFAGRFRLSGADAASFSFQDPTSRRFEVDQLEVLQGFPEEPVGSQQIANLWNEGGLSKWVRDRPGLPTNWLEFTEVCQRDFKNLEINGEVFLEALGKHPFHQNVVSRGIALLGVLDRVAAGLQPDGSLDHPAMELVVEHFQSKKAWFSNEEPSDKEVFMFPDHTSDGTKLYCSWHGKVKTPQFRLHFEWPVPVGQTVIKVLYFGEKLTKR
jgi:hypothetical protein